MTLNVSKEKEKWDFRHLRVNLNEHKEVDEEFWEDVT